MRDFERSAFACSTLSARLRRAACRLRERALDHGLPVVQRRLGAGGIERLAREAREIHSRVRRDHDRVGGRDVFRR